MIFGFFFLGVQTILALTKPKIFLFTYLLFISSFLGYIPRIIEINGYDVGLFYSNMLMFFIFLFKINTLKKYPNYIKVLLLFLFILYLYGIIYPFITGFSTIFQSIIASKEFSSLFLIHYLFINKKYFNFNFLHKVISFFGYYFLITLLIFLIFNYVPPQYIKNIGQIEYFYPTLLSLFLFIEVALADKIPKKLLAFLLIIVWGIGMFFEGHLAIMLTTFLGCLIVLLRIPIINFLKNAKNFLIGLGILGLILILPITQNYISELFRNPAFQSREFINKSRIDLIQKEIFQGYGFLDRRAFEFNSQNKYAKTLSYIDSGYIDLLGKFGIIGTSIYLSLLLIFVLKQHGGVQVTSLKLFIIQYFAVSLTWSVFTFSMGIVALAIGIFAIVIIAEEESFKNKISPKEKLQIEIVKNL